MWRGALLVTLLLGLAVAASGEGLARGGGLIIVNATSGQEFAVRAHTVIAGDLLGTLQRASLQDCVESCSSLQAADNTNNHTCSGFNYCDLPGGCLDRRATATQPQGTCQLLLPSSAGGIGVFQLGADEPNLGSGGVEIYVDDSTAPQLPSYVRLLAAGHDSDYDIPCPNSLALALNKCVVATTPQEAAARCTAWPECSGFVFMPEGPPPFNFSLATFKSVGAAGAMNMSTSYLSPGGVTYVKEGLLAEEGSADAAPSSEAGGGLSGGAIAGIAVGAACGAALVAVAAALLWCRHRRQAGPAGDPSGKPAAALEAGLQQADDSGEDCKMQSGGSQASGLEGGTHRSGASTHSDKRGVTPQLTSSGFVDFSAHGSAPLLASWEDVVVPRSAIEFVYLGGQPVRLGTGASGDVYKAVLHGATPCACKVFPFDRHCNTPKRFMQEACMLWRINALCHLNIVQFLGASTTNWDGLILMELMAGGDLHDALKAPLPEGKGPGRLFDWHHRGRRAALQIAVGMAFLHRHKIVHMDLKPKNVLLTREGNCKIGDVGFSKFMEKEYLSQISTQIGTFNWCAPELLLGEPATEKADIYSYGVILWEICTGERPQRGELRPLEAPADCPQEVVKLQRRCVLSDPTARPSAAEVVDTLRQLDRAGHAASSTLRLSGNAFSAGAASPGNLSGERSGGNAGRSSGNSAAAAASPPPLRAAQVPPAAGTLFMSPWLQQQAQHASPFAPSGDATSGGGAAPGQHPPLPQQHVSPFAAMAAAAAGAAAGPGQPVQQQPAGGGGGGNAPLHCASGSPQPAPGALAPVSLRSSSSKGEGGASPGSPEVEPAPSDPSSTVDLALHSGATTHTQASVQLQQGAGSQSGRLLGGRSGVSGSTPA